MSRVYVACKWEWRDRAKEIMTILEAAGHTITYDWTTCAQFSDEQAYKDVQGVMDAEALVLVMEQAWPIYKGTWCELGMAIARSIPIYILGTANRDTCIFMQLASLHYITSLDEIPAPAIARDVDHYREIGMGRQSW